MYRNWGYKLTKITYKSTTKIIMRTGLMLLMVSVAHFPQPEHEWDPLDPPTCPTTIP